MKRLLFLSVSILLCGCVESSMPHRVLSYNVNEAISIHIPGEEEILLDTTNHIGVLRDVTIINSDVYIHSSNKLHKYDLATGKMQTSFSRQGRAEDEYITLWDYFVKGDTVNIYDMNSKRILMYDSLGNFLYKKDVPKSYSEHPFQAIIPIRDFYVGKRIYGGEPCTELAFYDSSFKYIGTILPHLKLNSGLKLHNPFAVNSDGNVLYSKYFDNKIYEIQQDTSYVKYEINFGENGFGQCSEYLDEYEIINHINSSKIKYATNFSNLYETDSIFSFRYIFNGNKYLAIYDKENNLNFSVCFFPKFGIVENIILNGDIIYVFIQNEIGLVYWSIEYDMLKARYYDSEKL